MTSLVLALVLSAAPQSFYVNLEPSSVAITWQDAIVAGAVEEVKASHGRLAYTRRDPQHATARFVLSLRVAASGSTALATVKIAELSDRKVLRSDQVALKGATQEACVAAVRALVKKELEALPVDLPPPQKRE